MVRSLQLQPLPFAATWLHCLVSALQARLDPPGDRVPDSGRSVGELMERVGVSSFFSFFVSFFNLASPAFAAFTPQAPQHVDRTPSDACRCNRSPGRSPCSARPSQARHAALSIESRAPDRPPASPLKLLACLQHACMLAMLSVYPRPSSPHRPGSAFGRNCPAPSRPS